MEAVFQTNRAADEPLLSERLCRSCGVVATRLRPGVARLWMVDTSDQLALELARVALKLQGLTASLHHDSPVNVHSKIDEVYGSRLEPLPPAERTATPHTATVTPQIPPPGQEPGQRRLGELLLGAGHITGNQLATALMRQRRTGAKLGTILTHAGAVTQQQVADALATQLRLPRVDLSQAAVPTLTGAAADVLKDHNVVALGEAAGTLYIATADPTDAHGLASVASATGRPVQAVVTTADALEQHVRTRDARPDIHTAVHRLVEGRPSDSAHVVLSQGQKRFAIGLILVIAIFGILAPLATAIGLALTATIFYLTSSLYRFRLVEQSLKHEMDSPVTEQDIADLDERELPIYSVLLPMYKEAEVVPKLLRSLTNLDYPAEKLDILLLIEEDDHETRDEIIRMRLPPQFRMIIVPDAQPRTKPKACNYGLLHARGDFVVIYDAEDEPEPDQLKKVIAVFRALDDPQVVCVQCKLNYFNSHQNLLTAWFTTEYSMWFDLVLPGLDATDAPIPLGGTSNHFVTRTLLDLGAWDPHNVAEDADLGIRLARRGLRTAVVDSTTYEEATSDVHNWVRQRSRWVKGYIQSWLVHMRHPVQLWRELGPRRFLSFQLTVGGTFMTFLLNPVFWLLTTLWTFTEAGVIRDVFPGYLFYAAGAGLFAGNFLFTYLNAAGAAHRGDHHLVKYALLSPVYWGLMSLAAWKGALQLITKPHYWEKTIHGRDNVGHHG